jgi:outer membrane protein assembly factor BamD (BamD/ComL family)
MRSRVSLLTYMAAALLLTACASQATKDQTLAAAALYKSIQANLAAGNYKTAVSRLQTLEARFPFDVYGTVSSASIHAIRMWITPIT